MAREWHAGMRQGLVGVEIKNCIRYGEVVNEIQEIR